jgi:hypothetical protein
VRKQTENDANFAKASVKFGNLKEEQENRRTRKEIGWKISTKRLLSPRKH